MLSATGDFSQSHCSTTRRDSLALGHNLLRLSLARDKSVIVINHVPLPTASVEVITVRVRDFTNRFVYASGPVVHPARTGHGS